MSLVLAVDGGRPGSLSGAVLEHVAERLEIEGHTTVQVAPTESITVALRAATPGDPVVDLSEQADGVVVVVPAGRDRAPDVLRPFLGALAQRRPAGCEVLTVVHGAAGPYPAASDTAELAGWRPAIEVFVLDEDIDRHRCGVYLSGASDDRMAQACSRFLAPAADDSPGRSG